MASFPICPLIDQRCFLGISGDSTPGCMIVSLGKNIIIRFRLSDQKQLSSWTTIDKLSTPVFYDQDREEYFAIFNGERLSRWPKDKKTISKKTFKHKLPWVIDSLHCLAGIRPIMLFKSGTLALLDNSDKKSITVLQSNFVPSDEVLETNAYILAGSPYLCFKVNAEGSIRLIFKEVSKSERTFTIDVSRKESSRTLSCFTVIEEKSRLMTVWSDGSLHSLDVDEATRDLEEFPGRCVTTFTNINCSLPCVMLAMDNHVAVYGADSNGEGAKVVWVEASFGVVQNSLHLKLYSNPPRMWKVGSSYLITPVGQNLTVIPYQLKNTPKLDSLLGAHSAAESKATRVVWETVNTPETLDEEQPVPDMFEKMNDGYPESVLSQEIISSLLEQGKLKEAITTLGTMTDAPDKCVIDTVISCLSSKSKKSKTDFLLRALSYPLLNDNETLSYLRDNLSLESVVELLNAISDLIVKVPENDSLVKWLNLLLDSHYQQYLLSKDENVVNQITSIKEQVDRLISNMTEMQELYKLLTGSLTTKVSSKSSVHYTVDRFRLF